jgi:hypothetical protein
MLAADVHHPGVAVYNLHVLFDVLAPGGEIGAVRLVHRVAEHGASPDPAVCNGKVVYSCNQAVAFEADLHMYVALAQVEVVHVGAGVDTTNRPSGSFGEHRSDLLGFADTPVAVPAAYKHTLLEDLIGSRAVHACHLVVSPGHAFNLKVLSLPVDGIVKPPGNGTQRIGNMAGKSGRVHVIFDDVIGFPETFFNIAIIDIGIGDIALLGRVVAPSHAEASSTRFGPWNSRPDNRRVRLPPLAQVHNMGQHLPFDIKLP